MIQTLSQKRAKFALEEINNIYDKTKYCSFLAGVPSAILQNGLLQLMSFYYSKGKDNKGKDNKEYEVLKIIVKWLYQNKLIKETNEYIFIKELCLKNLLELYVIQEEVVKLCEWLKRYSKALGKGEVNNHDDQ